MIKDTEDGFGWPSDWEGCMRDRAWRQAVASAVESRDMQALLEACEVWMGLEIHLRLATGRKLFCAAPEGSAGWVDLGWPGALPSLDPQAVKLSVRLGRSLGAKISERIGFERKRYAYPDLSKGYQTTQKAFCSWFGGALRWEGGSMELERAQIEEDAAKVGRIDSGFEMDYARAGSPLLEVVSVAMPLDPAGAAAASKALWREAVHCGATEGLIQEGHFKTDINVSIRPKGSKSLGERVEVKGVGSFEFCELAAADAMWMLAAELLGGSARGMRTLGFDEQTGVCSLMRVKGSEAEYKFLPDGDLAMSAQVGEEGEALPSWRQVRANWASLLEGSKGAMSLLEDPRKTMALARLGEEAKSHVLSLGPQAAASVIVSFFSQAAMGSADSMARALSWSLGKASVGAKRSAVVDAALISMSGQDFDQGGAERLLADALRKASSGSESFEPAWRDLASRDPKALDALAQFRAGKGKALGYAVGALSKELAERGVEFGRQELSEWLASSASLDASIKGDWP